MDPTLKRISLSSKCESHNKVTAIADHYSLYEELVDAWSLKDLERTKSLESDFFTSFDRFNNAINYAAIVPEILQRSVDQNLLYVELIDPLINFDGIKNKKPWNGNFDELLQKMRSDGAYLNVIKNKIKDLDRIEGAVNAAFQCNEKHAQPACHVAYRYQCAVFRTKPLASVFADMWGCFELATRDKRVVGVNIISPEDDPRSIKDYDTHMKMFHYFKQLYPDVKLSLHAGELVFGDVPPEDLLTHIYTAVTVGGADRIGHGVDIAFERNAAQLLKIMAQKQIAVEVNLTSNEDILHTNSQTHPLHLYLQHNVPVVLSTDDDGVLRTDLNHEYQKAIMEYKVDYITLKNISRNSLTYAFLPGLSLWQDNANFVVKDSCTLDFNKPISLKCSAFLKNSPKATLQYELEKRFFEFEQKYSIV